MVKICFRCKTGVTPSQASARPGITRQSNMAAKQSSKDVDFLLNLYASMDSDDSDDDDDDVEFMMLSIWPEPPILGPRINLDSLSDQECADMFRFTKVDLTRLATVIGLPPKYVGYNGTVASGVEAFLLLLRRMVYPNRLCDLVELFGRSVPEMSIIINMVLCDIYERYHHLLDNLGVATWFDVVLFNRAIADKGAALQNCIGFIDGTIRPCCRPINGQRLVYNGHKRTHALKFQSVLCPNGIIAHLFGPIEGSRHDSFMLGESQLLQQLEARMNDANGNPYCLYGDPAYPLRPHLMTPFRGAAQNIDQRNFNRSMSRVRGSVEWSFGKIIINFAFLDFKKNQKILLQPVAKFYIVGGLFTNCHTCLYSSQTSKYFGIDPPSLESYLSEI